MPSPPIWLQELADGAAGCLTPVDLLSPLGCHFTQQDLLWEVTLFASRTEVVGGHRDGFERSSRFLVDVLALQRLFDEVEEVQWQPQRIGPDDDLGQHLSVVGRCAGEAVWLRILSRAPERFEAGRQARVYEMLWAEKW
jgi:hypothetical protein